ncbi:hypothetical protein J2X46_004278 [Nocardioides sp. BE266]|uniref:hypothetical protein n=1 Tax=Nocardioides sp. BE266 TaxID=2817725 RepID=UPI0028627DF8|nr:hypothetical protein [Nocardioides sp. BE266]MDR7255276.1 hypothetical protein [Nocardioides sp. BE266]
MIRLAPRLIAAIAPLALLAPAAAHAAEVTVSDVAGDAKAINMGLALGAFLGSGAPDGPIFLDAPAETSADVASTTIDHARKRLTLTMHFRDLVEVEGHSVEFRILTPEGRYDLSAAFIGGRTESAFSPARSSVTVSSDGSVTMGPESRPCRTVRARYDAAADTLVASVPTACLGEPKWVQVSAGVTRTKVTPQADGSANVAGYVDDAFRGGVSMRSLGRSPKVRRG